jgi:hypothetical protein
MSSSKYIQAAIRNVKDYVEKTRPGLKLAKHATGPFPTGYIPELDMTPELHQIPIADQCIELVCQAGMSS